jgi:hypothetical protein
VRQVRATARPVESDPGEAGTATASARTFAAAETGLWGRASGAEGADGEVSVDYCKIETAVELFILSIVVAIFLYFLRCQRILWYGMLEVLFGMCALAIGLLPLGTCIPTLMNCTTKNLYIPYNTNLLK